MLLKRFSILKYVIVREHIFPNMNTIFNDDKYDELRKIAAHNIFEVAVYEKHFTLYHVVFSVKNL